MIIVYLLMKYQKLQKKFGAFLLSRVVVKYNNRNAWEIISYIDQ